MLPKITLADTEFSGRVIAGYMDYNLSVPAEQVDRFVEDSTIRNAAGSLEAASGVEIFGVGGAVDFNDWFVDVYFQSSGTGAFRDSVAQEGSFFQPAVFNGAFERTDYSVSVGPVLDNGFSLSIGYKYGETDIASTNTVLLQSFFSDGSVDPFFRETFTSESSQKFEAGGPFVSLGYGFPFGAGVIGFSFGLADQEADYTFRDFSLSRGDTSISRASGSSTGTTLGVAWIAPITKKLNYKISLDRYDYDFDLTFDEGIFISPEGIEEPTRRGEGDFEVTETATTLRFELGYEF